MTKSEAILLASKVLGVKAGEAEKNKRFLKEHNAVYFWNPIRGGASMILAPDGTFLYAVSGVGFEEHLGAYSNGERTDPKLFGPGLGTGVL